MAWATISVIVGGVSLLFGITIFLTHGDRRITVLGLMTLAFGMFVGLSGVVEGLQHQFPGDQRFVTQAVMAGTLGQIAVAHMAWRYAIEDEPELPGAAPRSSAQKLTRIAVGILALLWLLQLAGVGLASSGYADGAAFTCVTLIAVGILLRDSDAGLLGRVIPIAVGFGFYTTFFHQGTGRLRIVALACALALLVSYRFPLRRLKWSVIACLPLALVWLAHERRSLQESLSAGSSEGRTGLESMFSPIRTFARVIEATATGEHPPALGAPFLSVPFSLVPESWQPDWTPGAIGYELVLLESPSRYGSGFSVASTSFGEWFYSFAALGVVLSVPFLAAVCVLLDRSLRRSMDNIAASPLGMLKVAFWAMLAGGLGDLAWGGVHTWIARLVMRMPILLLMIPLTWRPAEMQRTSSSASTLQR
ncbi:hypothetical protein [Cellulomonas bogoriensis]|uniref:Oligosaccharide repeat unit polymerase n=1 Tax=Cellulomonas bogoriensis 69B4 = DSM 16987 TaxID=1386082 RepID=A0A0A0C0M2_9CELL|nr:hypothetical protein [Cellulomonas bogoriensis]KGM13512.1 hypothetical protein N869_13560 [Cellulomonas bogoriensis 69B4 = DSM 16987]